MMAWYEHSGAEKDFPIYVMLPKEGRVQEKWKKKRVAFQMEGQARWQSGPQQDSNTTVGLNCATFSWV